MVSFICDDCQETIKKAKVQTHSWGCSSGTFSCIDCSVQFTRQTAKSHNTCISEAEKYQGKLYRGPKHVPTPIIPTNVVINSAHNDNHQKNNVKHSNEEGSSKSGKKRRRDDAAPTPTTNKPIPASNDSASDSTSVATLSAKQIAKVIGSVLQSNKDGLSFKKLRKRVVSELDNQQINASSLPKDEIEDLISKSLRKVDGLVFKTNSN